MQKIIILVLGIVALFLVTSLWKKQKQLSDCRTQYKDVKTELDRMKLQLSEEKQFSAKQLEEQEKQMRYRERVEQDVGECTEKSQELWNAIHTIHLYASISEEEAQSQQMKENQRTIIEICEEMLTETSK